MASTAIPRTNCAIGPIVGERFPQEGRTRASVETSRPHSTQGLSAIYASSADSFHRTYFSISSGGVCGWMSFAASTKSSRVSGRTLIL